MNTKSIDKVNYGNSPHDLMTRECRFTIKDCSGTYYLKRINAFGDSVLMHRNIDNEWENCATVSLKRKAELLLQRTTAGIVFEKRVKLSFITEIKTITALKTALINAKNTL